MRRRSEIRMDNGGWCGKSEVLFFQINYFLTSVNRHFQNFVVHSTYLESHMLWMFPR